MTSFNETIKLKGQGEEDIYFARRDRELIEVLHQKNLKEFDDEDHKEVDELANLYREELEKLELAHKQEHHLVAERYRELFAKVVRRIAGKH